MAKTILFEDNIKGFNTLKETDVIQFFFPFNYGVTDDQVDYIYPDCPICTKATVTKQGIRGTVSIKNAGTYEEGKKTPINKIITVKLKDGQPEYEGHPETKSRQDNKKSKKERLNINFVVDKT